MAHEDRPGPVTRELAEACLAAVREQFKTYLADNCGCGQPLLQEPGAQCGGWAIVWECHSPDEWTYRAFDGGFDEELYTLARDEMSPEQARQLAKDPGVPEPAGVFTEPVNRVVLGIYPAWR